MSKIVINFNRSYRLDKVCAKKYFRPSLECIHFKGGYAYASNAWVAIKVPIDELLGENFEGKEYLNEKFIHHSVYVKILRSDIIKILPEGIEAISPTGSILYKYASGEYTEKMPNIDAIIQGAKESKRTPTECVAISADLLKELAEAFGTNNGTLKLNFHEEGKAIFVQPSREAESTAEGVIMPVLYVN